MTKKSVTFIVDGFNLYHSIVQAGKDLHGASVKWLNIEKLCQSYIHRFGKEARLKDIYYFSALAVHLEAQNSNITKRHKDYIKCLENTGIIVELNKFKKKTVSCKSQSCVPFTFKKYEEKGTDVAIAVKMLELLINDKTDTLVIITGDTDLAPAVKTAQSLFPQKKFVFAFPYKRENRELKNILTDSFTIDKQQYVNHQFTNPYILSTKQEIFKPTRW